ncbi:hypothetical protein [Peribacillus butanolivorans]
MELFEEVAIENIAAIFSLVLVTFEIIFVPSFPQWRTLSLLYQFPHVTVLFVSDPL